jgi:hypothetical protein
VEKTCHDTATRVPTVFRMARKTSPYRSALLRVGPTLTAFYLRLDVAARQCLGSRIEVTSPFDPASPVSNWRLTPPWSFQSPNPHSRGSGCPSPDAWLNLSCIVCRSTVKNRGHRVGAASL